MKAELKEVRRTLESKADAVPLSIPQHVLPGTAITQVGAGRLPVLNLCKQGRRFLIQEPDQLPVGRFDLGRR